MIKFSPSQLKFYHTLRHGTPPTDCVEVSQSAYAGLMYQQSKGMVIQSDLTVLPPVKVSVDTKIAAINAVFNDTVKGFTASTTQYEVDSWDIQKKESRDWLADNTISTPYVDQLLTSRNNGETKLQLTQLIILKADAYIPLHAKALGEFHNSLKNL
jgi:hypothetical protein